MNDLIADVDITRIEHSFGGKLFQRLRDNRAAKREVEQTNKLARISARQTGGGVLGKIGTTIGSIFGKTTTATTDPAVMDERGLTFGYTDQAALDAEAKRKQQNMVITIIVVLVVVIVIALFVMKSKKAKPAPTA